MKKLIEHDVFERMLKRIAHEIIENTNLSDVVIIGIEKKGTPIALYLKDLIYKFEGVEITVDSIDISSYRDDDKKSDNEFKLETNIKDKTVILVDDVLFTGRSVRAAMDALMDYGRAKCIKLAVLVDRGHRELPIRADFIGKNLPTSRDEKILCDFNNKEVWIVSN